MIGYSVVGTDDIDRARAYYDALLGEIGARRVMQFDESGFTMYGTGGRKPGLAVSPPYDGAGASPGNGNMVALAMEKRADVDRLHAKAMELGSKDEGAPGLRTPEGDKAFYGAYFRDPDGNKLCAYKMGGAD